MQPFVCCRFVFARGLGQVQPLVSRIAEIVEEQFAQTDYRLKIQAKHFWDFLESLQSMRQGRAKDQKSR